MVCIDESLKLQNNISKSQMAVMLNLQETDLDNIINGNKLPDLITINKLKPTKKKKLKNHNLNIKFNYILKNCKFLPITNSNIN